MLKVGMASIMDLHLSKVRCFPSLFNILRCHLLQVSVLYCYFFSRFVTALDAQKQMPKSHSVDDRRSKWQKILLEVSESEQLICCNVAVLICRVMQVTNACWPNYMNPSRNFQTILWTMQI